MVMAATWRGETERVRGQTATYLIEAEKQREGAEELPEEAADCSTSPPREFSVIMSAPRMARAGHSRPVLTSVTNSRPLVAVIKALPGVSQISEALGTGLRQCSTSTRLAPHQHQDRAPPLRPATDPWLIKLHKDLDRALFPGTVTCPLCPGRRTKGN